MPRPDYETNALNELFNWQKKMQCPPGLWNGLTRGVQQRLNRLVPDVVHAALAVSVREVARGVLAGSRVVASPPLLQGSLEDREAGVRSDIDRYSRNAAIEGGLTGAGGLLLGLADFPLLLGIKLNFLVQVAAHYGFSSEEFSERLYMLYVLQLAFSSDQHRGLAYGRLTDWSSRAESLPRSIEAFDWQTFQQEYRDYMDVAKLAQLVPVIGAPVGIVVNGRLMRRLGSTAIHAYRMRWFSTHRVRPEAPPSHTSVK